MFKTPDDANVKPAFGITSPLKRYFLAGLSLGVAIGVGIGRLLH
jgi:hypothetical protein